MITLRKITPDDHLDISHYLSLYGLENENIEHAKTEIINNLNGFYHDFNLAVENEAKEVIGAVYSYNYMNYDLNCYMKVMVLPEYESFLEEIVCRFRDYLFKEYPLRYIYYKCTYADKEIKALETVGFEKTAVLKEYKNISGEYVDEIIFSKKR